jgi:hypothetical protein
MPAQITSRRADTGLPDVRNHFRCSDGTYYADGMTTADMRGSVLAGDMFDVLRASGDDLRRVFNEWRA